MKFRYMFVAAALAMAVSGCANTNNETAAETSVATTADQTLTVQGSVMIRQRIALPPDAVLTVTLSDATLADAPSKVISQWVTRTEGKQAPFTFSLPFNPADIQDNSRILLSAAVMLNGKLWFVTDDIKQVDTSASSEQQLMLIPVSSIPANN